MGTLRFLFSGSWSPSSRSTNGFQRAPKVPESKRSHEQLWKSAETDRVKTPPRKGHWWPRIRMLEEEIRIQFSKLLPQYFEINGRNMLSSTPIFEIAIIISKFKLPQSIFWVRQADTMSKLTRTSCATIYCAFKVFTFDCELMPPGMLQKYNMVLISRWDGTLLANLYQIIAAYPSTPSELNGAWKLSGKHFRHQVECCSADISRRKKNHMSYDRPNAQKVMFFSCSRIP